MWNFPANFNPGAIEHGPDARDIPYGALIPKAYNIDWANDFDLLKHIGLDLPIKDQGASSSCVGQASSYLAEIAEFKETGIFTRLSARDIYSRIYLTPDGGAYGYKGLSTVVNRGVATDERVLSYENGNPPSEAFMRTRDNSPESVHDALVHKGKNYATLDMTNIDELAYAIENQGGIVFGVAGSNPGWQNGMVRPPNPGETRWGHYHLGTRRVTINGTRYIVGPNSWSKYWGENGYTYFPESYFSGGFAFDGFTLVDLPNSWLDQIAMKRRIVLAGAQDQYTVEGNRINLIPDLDTLAFLRDESKVVADGLDTVQKGEFDSYLIGRPWPSVTVDRLARSFYTGAKDAFEPNK